MEPEIDPVTIKMAVDMAASTRASTAQPRQQVPDLTSYKSKITVKRHKITRVVATDAQLNKVLVANVMYRNGLFY